MVKQWQFQDAVRQWLLGVGRLALALLIWLPPSLMAKPLYPVSFTQAANSSRGMPAHFHISTREQMYIRDWYRRHPGRLTQRAMPQHFELRVGGPLPPPRSYVQLPEGLVHNLQALPEGYGYFRFGDDVMIADSRRGRVVDVVYGLLNR